MKRWLRTTLVWGGLLALVFAVYFARARSTRPTRAVLTVEQTREMVSGGRIASGWYEEGELIVLDKEGRQYAVEPEESWRVHLQMNRAGVPIVQADPHDPDAGGDPHGGTGAGAGSTLYWLVPLATAVAVLFFVLRRFSSAQGNVLEFRKSRVRRVEKTDTARFADVGGNAEAVEILADLVDFLRSPERWKKAGARIPRGVLIVGPPGTGKTLLARAVAGETDAAFFHASAAEFVEMFVGVGAARMRDTFEKAAAARPAIVFLDELDAIGRRRGTAVGAMHEEREQTLNQLLVLMDGLERHDRLVVMAATNRPDVLDPALLRPGRFDRMIRLAVPDAAGRRDILRIHVRDKPLDADVDLDRIADRCDGFSGADLEALVNEAVLHAVRRTRPAGTGPDRGGGAAVVVAGDFDAAFEKTTRSNRLFDRLDAVLVESVSQFSEPVGAPRCRLVLGAGRTVEGTVLWMNATHVKLRADDGCESVVAKEHVEQFVSLDAAATVSADDFRPDRWAGRSLESR